MPSKDSDNLFNLILKHFQVFLQKISLSLHLFFRNELFNHAGAAAFFFILSIPPVFLLLLIAFAELTSRKGPDRNYQFLPLNLLDRITLCRRASTKNKIVFFLLINKLKSCNPVQNVFHFPGDESNCTQISIVIFGCIGFLFGIAYLILNWAKVEDAPDPRHQGRSRSKLLRALDNKGDGVSSTFA